MAVSLPVGTALFAGMLCLISHLFTSFDKR